MKIDKDKLLNESKTFCMLPWMHIHSTPLGRIYPCCVAKGDSVGHIADMSLREAFNSNEMKELRLDMLKEKYNPLCTDCHEHDKIYNNGSFRMTSNRLYEKFFDEVVPLTEEDGRVEEFKMKYFDVRFSNICNFKCRTCGSNYSSQWERENIDHRGIKVHRPHNKTNTITLLEEAIQHIPYMEEAYFAGGEPLITLEHYELLEEMIRQGRTDIILRYNTNCSTLNFKNKDLLSLWKNFKQVRVTCSIDHYGTRAQYLRNGTIWPEIQENFMKIKSLPYVETRILTILSVFNYLTITEFFAHLLMNDMLKPGDPSLMIYKMHSPNYLSPHILPPHMKEIGRQKILDFVPKLNSKDAWLFPEEQILELTDCISWAESKNTWDTHKYKFQEEILLLDRIRQEDFIKTFPELESLMDGTPKQKPPVI